MAQKKKAPVSPKSAAKPAVRKAVPLKVAASTQKSAKPAKTKSAAVSKPPKSAPAGVAAKTAKKVAPKAETAPKKPLTAATHLAAKAAAAAGSQRAIPAGAHKPAGQKLSTSVASAAQQPASPKAIAEKAAAARQLLAVQKKPVNQRHGFKANEFVVYPAHGVGRIVGIEEQEIAGMSLELFVITFDKEKLTLRVPTGKLASVGMRKLADENLVKKAMETLKGRARIKRTMWSRRAQEYVAKINSGDLISIAEVVRDLYRSEAQPEQSYSERQLYEDALDRMARELAAVEKLDERGAVQRITDILSKSAKGRRIAENESSVGEAA
ncbi:CarD family transcriptional regulator [Hyphomicrobium sp.]|jgi:CarD family transcriptional regulator|uniref:CarD family transcriptional regulator n=1 Tax=Hyphomicrobium sp. TaxID=82 RepID=UPI002C75AEDD|nr:CarD family transcriptional regulator [Hyphomicrobium sp.]HVZ04780.1 CarD family transcriptional regulator [Hyphomicrobium sp.]